MSGDRVGKLLRDLAQKCVETAPDDMGDVLEERLGPLLRAGQAMREQGPAFDPELDIARRTWDAALAALERER